MGEGNTSGQWESLKAMKQASVIEGQERPQQGGEGLPERQPEKTRQGQKEIAKKRVGKEKTRKVPGRPRGEGDSIYSIRMRDVSWDRSAMQKNGELAAPKEAFDRDRQRRSQDRTLFPAAAVEASLETKGKGVQYEGMRNGTKFPLHKKKKAWGEVTGPGEEGGGVRLYELRPGGGGGEIVWWLIGRPLYRGVREGQLTRKAERG